MTDSAAPLLVRTLGLVPYRDALALQERAVEARAGKSAMTDTLFLLEHPPVLTAGRGTGEGSVLATDAALAGAGLEVVPVSRGGDVTWHGPGQLVGYLVCDVGARGRDLHAFLRGIEQGLIDALGDFGIAADRSPGRTGVWVGDEKIASIGIAVRKWVTYHGFALNVRPSLEHFGMIHPCGLRGIQMTTMAARLGAACPSWDAVLGTVSARMAGALGHAGLATASSLALPEGARWSEVSQGSLAGLARESSGGIAPVPARHAWEAA